VKLTKFIVMMSFSHLCFAYPAEFEICKKQICETIVDIGSSGFRVNVYTLNPVNFKQKKELPLIYKKKIKVGPHQLNAESLPANFNELFSEFPDFLMNTYVYSTESYRSLPLSLQMKYSAILRQWFRDKPYLNLREMRSLSGAEEAVYAWISNYFNYFDDLKKYRSNGVIEVGGGSAQVAVSYPGISPLKQTNNIYRFNWFDGHIIQLWVKSLNHYGRDKMAKLSDCKPSIDITICLERIYKAAKPIEPKKMRDIFNNLKNLKNITHWHGLGLLTFVGDSPLFDFNQAYSLYELLTEAQNKACKLSFADLKTSNIPYAEQACFNSAYVYALTHHMMGLEPSTLIHFYSEDNGQGWTQGVVIKRYLDF
jgi:hypothetical protein